ncbi:MAG: TCP-1/cpn60 chaperonin family protein, partial [bacterium]
HEQGKVWAGVDVDTGKAGDMEKAGVFEPIAVKKQIIKSCSEAAGLILKIDDVIASGKMKTPPMPPGGGMGGMGMPPGM